MKQVNLNIYWLGVHLRNLKQGDNYETSLWQSLDAASGLDCLLKDGDYRKDYLQDIIDSLYEMKDHGWDNCDELLAFHKNLNTGV